MNRRSMKWLGACIALFTVASLFAACTGDDNIQIAASGDASVIQIEGGPSTGGGCTANAKECVSATLARVCPADGSGWLSVPCGAGGTCNNGDCSVPAATCTPAQDTCTSSTAALNCNANGQGFTSKTCPSGTTCTGPGLCEGACVVGSGTCSGDATAVGICADGNTVTQTACPSGQLCVTTSASNAAFQQTACKPAACSPDSCAVCGDKTNAASDQTKFTSSCVASPGGYVYQATGCEAPQTCNSAASGCGFGGNTAACQSNCTPGATRCSPTSNGIQTCDATGNWAVAVTNCNANPAATTLVCATTSTGAICADAFCALGGGGTCDPSGNLRSCGSDGKLAAAPGTACATGACVTGGPVVGIPTGSCQDQCLPGDTRCTGPGATSFETCSSKGLWGAPAECASDAVCFDYTSSTNRPAALCGGVCSPGTHRCTDDGGVAGGTTSIETCSATGTWGATADCTVGVCVGGTTDAACLAECVPNSSVCDGNSKTGNGTFGGSEATGTCTAHGLLPATPNCAGITDGGMGCCEGATTCRTGASGIATGCVECVGPSIPGGNENGQTDTKCTDSTGDAGTSATETCGATNVWPAAPTACPGSTSCATGVATCGSCNVFSCVPGPCAPIGFCCSSQPIANCTDGNVPGGCAGSGQGLSGACGTTPDCCSNACGTTTDQTAFCH